MSTVREFHRQAMAIAQKAMVERESGNSAVAAELAGQALPLELEAARLIEKTIASEPTRSILYQSAASLAYQAGDFAGAQRLAAEGLSGFPPPRVERDLKDLFEQINFASHLQVRNDLLGASQFQLAIVGNEVGFGQVTYSTLQDKLKAVITMLGRTVQRLLGEPYRRGGPETALSKSFTPLISSPRAGSFSVTISLAQREGAQTTFITDGAEIIDEVLRGVDRVQNNELERLHDQINDTGYYNNFISQAQQLAPDGDRVKMVGLTSPKRQVSFTTPRNRISAPLREAVAVSSSRAVDLPATITGILDEATVRNAEEVGLTTEDGRALTLRVREGMDDLVRNYFNRLVIVRIENQVHGNAEIVEVVPIEE